MMMMGLMLAMISIATFIVIMKSFIDYYYDVSYDDVNYGDDYFGGSLDVNYVFNDDSNHNHHPLENDYNYDKHLENVDFYDLKKPIINFNGDDDDEDY